MVCGCFVCLYVRVSVCDGTDVPFWSLRNVMNCSEVERTGEVEQRICCVPVRECLVQGETRCVANWGDCVRVCVCVCVFVVQVGSTIQCKSLNKTLNAAIAHSSESLKIEARNIRTLSNTTLDAHSWVGRGHHDGWSAHSLVRTASPSTSGF